SASARSHAASREAVTMAFLWTMVFVDPLIILSTIFFGTISVTASFFEKDGRIQTAMARYWARSLLKFAGTRVTVEGIEKICLDKPYVFVSNHLSYMDTPVVLGAIPVQFRFMAKKGLFQIPFLGTHLMQAGHIPVPLDDARASVKTLHRAAQTIRDRGISILIFPEGGRSINGVLQDFKEGAAYIAIKAGVPVVPVTMVGTRRILAMGTMTFHSGAVKVRISDPIPTAGMTLHDRRELTAKIRGRIVEML
ncbi:MAG TPA: lysophospholipid acyltransferase family protein, partial [Bryobacteraceae bacterium]|nr:lysophospholipid acyltransferase family protein [Bryobacteraceae bacterium]